MPYEITQSGCPDGKPYAVRVQGGGRVMGCHESRAKAQAQLRALYANDPDARREKTAIKRESGMDFPPRDYAYVPDPLRPATWRLRLTDAPGQISLLQLQRAALALSPAGYRGNRVEIPQTALSSVKRRLLAEFRRLGVAEGKIPATVKEKTEHGDDFMLWKDAKTGLYRWFAIYSNNFRDDDHPPQIIAETSHLRFVEMVDKGIVDYPELWLWHVKGTTWGKADWLAYADGFAMASGLVYPEYEHIAQNLSKVKGLRVSHGMPETLLAFDPDDDSIIAFHVTAEISPLPGWAAANKLTGFTILGKGGQTMPLPSEKRKFIEEAGLSKEVVDRLEANLKEIGEAATEAGIQSKESGADEDAATENEDTAAETPMDAEESELEAATKEAAEDEDDMMMDEMAEEKPKPKKATARGKGKNYVTTEEVADVIAQVVTPLIQGIDAIKADNAALVKQVKLLKKEVRELRSSDEERLARTKEVTPTLSLSDIIRQRVIGQDAAKIRGNSMLGKDGPVETEASNPADGATMVPFINGLMSRARGGKS